MKVIVIGAKGLAGSAFCRVFSGLGHDIVPLERSSYGRYVGSACDVLINANGNSAKYLAAQDPAGEIDRSVTSVMRSCMDFTYKKYVFLSSADVYSNQANPCENREEIEQDTAKLSPYGLCKLMAETIVRNRAPQWWILRLGGLLGPGLRKNPLYDLLSKQPLRVHPDSEFSFIHTDEVAGIVNHLITCTSGNEVWNVCGDGEVSVRQMAEWCKRTAPEPQEGMPVIRYRINHDKLRAVRTVPHSSETVKSFIATWEGDRLR